jgi:hypothetical protein
LVSVRWSVADCTTEPAGIAVTSKARRARRKLENVFPREDVAARAVAQVRALFVHRVVSDRRELDRGGESCCQQE